MSSDIETSAFQPMLKRFMVWDKEERRFLTYLSSKSVDFEYLLILIDHHHITLSELGSRYILIQSTNLFDKDGKEIFEGSIIKVNDDFDTYGMNAGEIYQVYFYAGGFRCKPKYGFHIHRGDRGCWIEDGNDFELVGHIFENPELLRGVKSV